MIKTYSLTILGASGMYTRGKDATSPSLALLSPGNMIVAGRRVGIIETVWRVPDYIVQTETLVDAEERAGQWEIGVHGGDNYRPAIGGAR